MLDLIVTIPAYNEEQSISEVVSSVLEATKGQKRLVLVVSDGSTDDTERKARLAGAVAVGKRHSGLADTFKFEMELVNFMKPRVIVHIDGDGQYSARDIPLLLKEIERGKELVLGNRLDGTLEHMPTDKLMLNRIASAGLSVALRQRIPDITTGFRAFTLDVAKKIEIQSRHTYTVEQIIRAKRAGFRISSVPVQFYKRRNGNSHLMKHSAHYIWETIKNGRRMVS